MTLTQTDNTEMRCVAALGDGAFTREQAKHRGSLHQRLH